MVWSTVIVRLNAIGFSFSTDQLFWLAALPGLSGATFRIFYSFMVPVFGGRLLDRPEHRSLMIPSIWYRLRGAGPGYALQPCFVMLALLCGFGGGNFASSMSNISFFYPKARRAMPWASNAGLGNLGVSAMQFSCRWSSARRVRRVGGKPARSWRRAPLWLQNAGLMLVPLIARDALATGSA